MKEVSEAEFWAGIMERRLDVHPDIEGNYPYTAVFRYRNRVEYGRIVDTLVEQKVLSKYFLTTQN